MDALWKNKKGVLPSQKERKNYSLTETSSHVVDVVVLKVGINELEREQPGEFLKYELNRLSSKHEQSEADENIEVLQRFKESIRLNGEESRYVVTLTEKENHNFLPDNFNVSKLERDQKLREEYDNIHRTHENEGIIERVETNGQAGRVHYLPHRAVVREYHDTTKVRTVFDASSKQGDQPSLNDCLYSCMLSKIPDIISPFSYGRDWHRRRHQTSLSERGYSE